jgi:hypothetical protein
LLGEEDALTVNTGLDLIPTLRAIVKDRTDEQYTIITFTLAGSLEEFKGETNWNGRDIDVIFTYSPAMSEPEATVQPEAVEEIEVHGMPEAVDQEPAEEEVKPEEQPIIFQAEEHVASAEPSEAEPEGEAVGPVRIEQPAEPVEEQEELGAEVGSEGGNMVLLAPDREENTQEIGGAVITGITIESTGLGDIIHLTSDGALSGWEVTPANYPTKLVVKIPNSRPVFANGDPER